MLLDSTLEY